MLRRVGKWVLIGIVVLVVIAVIAGSPDEEGTADATRTPQTSASPGDTSSATDEGADQPTAASEPTPLPTPTGTPELAFQPITLTGTGSSVPEFSIPEDQAAIATIAHQGASNFAVISLSDDGEQQDLLVNTIGNYAGTVLFDETAGSHSVAFEITADGPWTIEIKPVLAARSWDLAGPLTGTGDDVVLIGGPLEGLTTARFVHDGESNFAVIGYSGSGADLIVNDIGPYNAQHRISSDTLALEITADGGWSITIE